jgi:hypothetical protein
MNFMSNETLIEMIRDMLIEAHRSGGRDDKFPFKASLERIRQHLQPSEMLGDKEHMQHIVEAAKRLKQACKEKTGQLMLNTDALVFAEAAIRPYLREPKREAQGEIRLIEADEAEITRLLLKMMELATTKDLYAALALRVLKDAGYSIVKRSMVREIGEQDDMLIPNLVMLIGRLCYRLKVCPQKTEGNIKIIAKTMDYLKRKGLEKNALRYEESRNKPEIEDAEGK